MYRPKVQFSPRTHASYHMGFLGAGSCFMGNQLRLADSISMITSRFKTYLY